MRECKDFRERKKKNFVPFSSLQLVACTCLDVSRGRAQENNCETSMFSRLSSTTSGRYTDESWQKNCVVLEKKLTLTESPSAVETTSMNVFHYIFGIEFDDGC